MIFKWFDAGEAAEVGTALADDFVLQSFAGPSGERHGVKRVARTEGLPKALQKFLQRVDRDARALRLNVFKRAKLANSFKWRLLEKGVEPQLVDELTQALVLRLTAGEGGAVPPVQGARATRRASARDAQALHARAGQALERREYAAAREGYQDLVNHDPRDAAARNGLGIALAQLGRYLEAEEELRRALGLMPSNPEAHLNLAGVLQSRGRYDDAEMPLKRALKLKPAYLDARVSLAMTYLFAGRLTEARDSYEKALRLSPRNVRALVGIGQIDALEGRFEQAEAAYRRALEVEPGSSAAWAALVWLRKMTREDAAWVRRAEEIAVGGLTPIDEATLRFAIGKYYDDVGDFARAFRSYQRANELHRLRAEPYDRERRTRFVDAMVHLYTDEAVERARAAPVSESERPVFVVGMPRSGTSLVEQIIASHPSAYGAGELNFWTIVVRKHEATIRRGLLPAPVRRKLAAEYLKVLAGHSADALRVVDKAPVNADYLGLIHRAFPRARIINMQRDPIDTCLSCYFQQFAPSFNYTLELADLAHYYREHQRLMAHWRRVLPAGVMLDVPYAELTADQEQWSRRIIEFIGLPWDARSLAFEQTTRVVNTASVWQVRQKMYRSSVERWRNYEKFIGPLRGLANLSG